VRTLPLHTGNGLVSKFELFLDIRHPATAGLQWTITAPNGEVGQPTLKSIDKNLIATYSVPNFHGKAHNGNMVLKIVDNTPGGVGFLAYWRIRTEYSDYQCQSPEIAQSLWMILDLKA